MRKTERIQAGMAETEWEKIKYQKCYTNTTQDRIWKSKIWWAETYIVKWRRWQNFRILDWNHMIQTDEENIVLQLTFWDGTASFFLFLKRTATLNKFCTTMTKTFIRIENDVLSGEGHTQCENYSTSTLVKNCLLRWRFVFKGYLKYIFTSQCSLIPSNEVVEILF